jgi:hypothetical protein
MALAPIELRSVLALASDRGFQLRIPKLRTPPSRTWQLACIRDIVADKRVTVCRNALASLRTVVAQPGCTPVTW